jgi:hypothetical protein
VRNPESDSAGYPACYWADYLPGNPVSYSGSYWDRNSAGYSADCPVNRPERNPESNWESNGADNSPDSSESDSVDSLPDCSASYLPGLSRRKRRFHPALRDTGAAERMGLFRSGVQEDCPRKRGQPCRDMTELRSCNSDRVPSLMLFGQDHLADRLRLAA